MADRLFGGPGLRETTTARFRDAGGVMLKAELAVSDDNNVTAPGLLAHRRVLVDGEPLLQKWVPRAAGERSPELYDLLDAEVRALCRLAQVYALRHPEELPRLRGYNVDVLEPFLLVEPYAGEPAPDIVRRLEAADQVAFQHGLLRVLRMTDRAGVVHNEVGLRVLRWTGRTVQLTSFERARLTEPGGAAADVPAAGTVIRQVVLGPMADRDVQRDPAGLREALAGVSAPDPADRPTIAVLMARMHAGAPTVPVSDPVAPFSEGRAEFDRVSTVKRGGPPLRPVAPAPAAEPRPATTASVPGPRLLTVAVLLVMLAAVVVLIVVLVVTP